MPIHPTDHPTSHLTSHPLGRALGGLALGLTLSLTAACGGDDAPASSATAAAADHNDADVAFATDMLQHHAQALDMVDMTRGRTLDPEVSRLAERIEAAQAPEIETFTSWLEAWGEEVPDTDGGSMSMDSGMPGMMSDADMEQLDRAPDSRFQELWLTMMIEHHRGAVDMATREVEQGEHAPATELAERIRTSQTEEVAEMRRLLG